MTKVVSFTPLHNRIVTLVAEYVESIREVAEEEVSEQLKAYLTGWLEAASEDFYAELVESQKEVSLEEKILPLLAEIAFWKGVARLYLEAGKFALADKLKFMPPRVPK
jgi:hypothetical protein